MLAIESSKDLFVKTKCYESHAMRMSSLQLRERNEVMNSKKKF